MRPAWLSQDVRIMPIRSMTCLLEVMLHSRTQPLVSSSATELPHHRACAGRPLPPTPTPMFPFAFASLAP
jgi:hypothetical protein